MKTKKKLSSQLQGRKRSVVNYKEEKAKQSFKRKRKKCTLNLKL